MALNHERAAGEKRGLVRWLRPEFQAKGDADDEPAAQSPKRGKCAEQPGTVERAARKEGRVLSG